MPDDDQTQGAGAFPADHGLLEETLVPGMDAESGGNDPSAPRGVTDFREFSRALIEIGLVGADELEGLAADSSEGVLGLSRALVEAGKLTPYQAAAVYQKKSRGLLIGNYIILDKIGQGGMGMVFKARHRRLGRVGALKILPPSFARDRTAVLRFRREVEAAGRLKHPNVVVALDADEDRGVHFLVMEFVAGRDLDRVVRDRGPLPVSLALDYLIQAARGLEAAHAQGIVHRDMKPGNLMLDSAGTVRVLDLGLARIVDAANPFGQTAGGRLTESGMYMGTIDFMAPEQAEDSRKADHRADIYALGCTLHYLLTGRSPFDGPTVLKRLMAHMEQPAPSLRTPRPEVPRKLEDIYQKMMAKHPADRPATMTELILLLESCKAAAASAGTTIADSPKPRPELMVFDEKPLKRPAPARTKADPSIFARPKEPEGLQINHDFNLEDLIMDVRSDIKPEPLPKAPGRARPPNPLRSGQVISRTRRRPRAQLAAILLGIGASVVLAAAFARFVLFSASRLKTGAVASTDSAVPDQSAEKAAADLKTSPAEQDYRSIFDGKSSRGWMLCDKKPLKPSHVQRDGLNPHGTGSYLVVYEEKLADFELDFDYKLDKGCNAGVFLRVSNLADPIHTGIEVALDDTTGHGFGDSGAFYGLVAPEMNAQKPAPAWNHMTITAQGPKISVVLNGSPVSTIHLDEWTVPGKRPDGTEHKFANVAIASLARSGYVGFQDLGGNCWFNQIKLRKLSPASVGNRGSMARKAAPATIPAPSALEPYVETAQFAGHAHPWVETIRVSPDGKKLLTACADMTARLWDIATGRELQCLWHPAGLRPVAYHPDGRRAVTGCNDGIVRLWDLETGKLIRVLSKHPGPVAAVAISSDGLHVLSGGENNTLRLLEVETGRLIQEFDGVSVPIWSVAFSPDGHRILAGGSNGLIFVGDPNSRDRLQTLSGHSETVWDLTVAPDNRHAVSAGRDGRVIYWDLDARSAARQIKLDNTNVRCVALQADGRHVIFGGQQQPPRPGVLGFWGVTANQPSRLIPGKFGHLGLAILPRGGIATADDGGIALIWEPSAALALARELRKAGKSSDALTQYDKAIAGRPGDARLLIECARLLTSMAQDSRADADFEKAARLAPESPQLFVDAGWWAAAPYPPGLDPRIPIETSATTSPSAPPPPSENNSPRWRELPVGSRGVVDLGELSKGENVAAYALTLVYSASTREVVFKIGNDDGARFWLNGQQVIETALAPVDTHSVIVTLRAGRNVILAKVVNTKGPHGLFLTIADTPSDFTFAYAESKEWAQAIDAYIKAIALDPNGVDPRLHEVAAGVFAQAGRWKEAKGTFEKIAALDPGNFNKQLALSRCYLALGDSVSYRRLCENAVAQHGKTKERGLASNVIWMTALIPDAVRNYAEVVEIGHKWMNTGKPDPNLFNTYGAVLYRAKKYQPAVGLLKRSIDAKKGKGDAHDWAFLAMALHKSKQPGDREAFSRAKTMANAPSVTWQLRVELNALIEEATRELE